MVNIMNILNATFRTIFFYFFIIVVFRLMGKREIGELSLMDLVVSLLIAELVAISIENYDESMLLTIIPIVILLVFEIIFGVLSVKSEKFRTLVDGKPSLIINKGKINKTEMKKQRYSLDDLLLQLREKDVSDIREVDYAILEINGKLSVFKKKDNNRNTFPLPIIIDGKVDFYNLYSIKKSNSWLLNTLINKNIKVEDVFYSFYQNNELYIIKNSEAKN